MMQRLEATGLGVALAGHAALFAAIWYLMQRDPPRPPQPSIEVSFVDEVGLVSGGETTAPAAASVAPELGAPEEAAPAPPAPAPEPDPAPAQLQPQPAPRQQMPAPAQQRSQPETRPTPRPTPQPARADPRAQQRTDRQQSGSGSGRTDRGSRLGSEILDGIGKDPASRSDRPTGAVMTAAAQADIASMIRRQVLPCANRQRSPGPGAERIRVTIRLRINRDGSLAAPPTVTARTGVDDSNSRYAERVDDLAINTFQSCAPLRGLPAELYDVPNGWRDFRLRYNLPR
jgi:outer membrane biosynthesis protein TonB